MSFEINLNWKTALKLGFFIGGVEIGRSLVLGGYKVALDRMIKGCDKLIAKLDPDKAEEQELWREAAEMKGAENEQ